MKIYNKIVIQDGKVIEEDSYEYEGPVALCMGRRSKPAPPPPPPPPPPPVEDIREEVREEIEAEERLNDENVRKRRGRGRGRTETGALGISETYTGTRRNLLG